MIAWLAPWGNGVNEIEEGDKRDYDMHLSSELSSG